MATGQLSSAGKVVAIRDTPVYSGAVLKPRWPAFLCALALLLCALATHPVAEIGMIDDWSYVQSARVLAQSGHVVYNGWAGMMLGWQLYLGALFIKLFGSSFTAVRASTLLVALATAVLTQRVFVRTGINSRNATIGTLAFVLSPLFLPLALSFMSDIGGLFCVVLCLYACLRAMQAPSDRAVLGWLAFAALSNAAGGTVRQIAWLGVLVMFPSAVWLLRRRPGVLPFSAILYAISLLIIFASNHWFLQQPYSVPDSLPGLPGFHALLQLAVKMTSLFLSGVLLLLPVLFAFVPAISLRNPRTVVILTIGLICEAVCIYVFLHHGFTRESLTAPFLGNYVSRFGLGQSPEIKDAPPLVLSIGFRIFLTSVLFFVLVCFLAWLATGRLVAPAGAAPQPIGHHVSWPDLLILLLPFVIAYVVLLIPRAIGWNQIFDRYNLSLLPIALLLLLRLYQDRVRPDLPPVSIALVLLFAAYAVAGTRDDFSEHRALLAAVDELRAAGIPDTSIDAGFEHNGMSQIVRTGYVNDPRIRVPAAIRIVQPPAFPDRCRPYLSWLFPVIVPGYALSFDPNACGGLSQFPPVTYPEWLVARSVPIYIVNTVKTVNARR